MLRLNCFGLAKVEEWWLWSFQRIDLLKRQYPYLKQQIRTSILLSIHVETDRTLRFDCGNFFNFFDSSPLKLNVYQVLTKQFKEYRLYWCLL